MKLYGWHAMTARCIEVHSRRVSKARGVALWLTFFVTLAFAVQHDALLCDAADRAEDEQSIAVFDMGDRGDYWSLPVTIGNNAYRFLVDTGTGRPVFDTSLRAILGRPLVDDETFTTVAGSVNGELFAAPDAQIGPLRLDPTMPVGCLDLGYLRRSAGPDVTGAVGATFLGKYIVQFDFERARLRFLEAVPNRAGILLNFDEGDDPRPYCRCLIDRDREEPFLIDTGAVTRFSISLRSDVFDELAENAAESRNAADGAALVLGRPRVVKSAVGTSIISRCGRLRRLGIAGFEAENVDVRAADKCRLNLKLLSQFIITIDFPNRRMYLRPIQGAENDEYKTGIFLRRDGDRTFIGDISEGGSGARSGLGRGDEVLAIDGVDAGSTHIFALRRLLFRSGQGVRLSITRANAELDIVVKGTNTMPNERM